LVKFLPNNFEQITVIYQKPSTEDIIFLIKDKVYVFTLPTLTQLQPNYPKSIRDEYKISTSIAAAITTYSGDVYLLLSDNKYIKPSSCCNLYKATGLISDLLQGIPNKITGAFKYLNGKLYFLIKIISSNMMNLLTL
jgi:hypothetical protein